MAINLEKFINEKIVRACYIFKEIPAYMLRQKIYEKRFMISSLVSTTPYFVWKESSEASCCRSE